MPMTIAELDVIRERLLRALDVVEDASQSAIAGRSETQPDAYALAGDDVVSGAGLSEAMECCDMLAPVEVRGWAVVRRFWAVRVPIGGANGEIDGDDIMQFSTEAEADAFVASAEAA